MRPCGDPQRRVVTPVSRGRSSIFNKSACNLLILRPIPPIKLDIQILTDRSTSRERMTYIPGRRTATGRTGARVQSSGVPHFLVWSSHLGLLSPSQQKLVHKRRSPEHRQTTTMLEMIQLRVLAIYDRLQIGTRVSYTTLNTISHLRLIYRRIGKMTTATLSTRATLPMLLRRARVSRPSSAKWMSQEIALMVVIFTPMKPP